jgi:hypothetical protein
LSWDGRFLYVGLCDDFHHLKKRLIPPSFCYFCNTLSLGIGHFYTGWVLAPCRAPMARAWNRRIPNLLGIPPGNELYGALALGYPIPKFKNMIERKPPQIGWV